MHKNLIKIKLFKDISNSLHSSENIEWLLRYKYNRKKRKLLYKLKHPLKFAKYKFLKSLIQLPYTNELFDSSSRNNYTKWITLYDNIDGQASIKILAEIDKMPFLPKISIIMPTYDPPLEFLDKAICSVRNQLYKNWELCIADDASKNDAVLNLLKYHSKQDDRIKLVFRNVNGHISEASNSALELATGDFIALFDNDDLLPSHALFYVAQTIIENPDAALIYSDEDKIDTFENRQDPYFKPDWNPDLFLSHNMICHLGVYKRSMVEKIGGFRKGFDGSQDYDLALRFIENISPTQIIHIQKVLYHWRIHSGSTALSPEAKPYAYTAAEKAFNEHFYRTNTNAKAELLENYGMFRVHYALPKKPPLISIIIPTRNGLDLIKQCVDSLITKTSYSNYEVIIIDNGSDDGKTLEYFENLKQDNRIRILRDERAFNFSALNNAAVEKSNGEYVCLLNNDTEIISPNWLEEMVSIAIQPNVGAVGARLWYPNDTLQHGGVIVGIGGTAGHAHRHLPRGQSGYFARANLIQTMSAVTAACLLIKKEIYIKVGGLDEVNLKVAFNDVDFCLKVRESGYRNVWTPYAELYHHESATRGYEDTPEKKLRFQNETLYLQNKWKDKLLKDPAYNPNLTLDHEDFSLSWREKNSEI